MPEPMGEPLAPLTKYRPTSLLRADAPLIVLGVTNVIGLEEGATVPSRNVRVSAAGKWSRDVVIPDGTAEVVADLAARFNIVWASEWGPNAHLAFREALRLPDQPWPYLPVQFDKLGFITRFAAGRQWAWIDDPLVDLAPLPSDPGGIVIRVDPQQGLAGVDIDAMGTALRAAH